MSFVDKKGIVVASGFKLQAEVLLDARQQLDTIEERNELVTIHAATAGLRVFVKETGKSYVYNGTTWQELTVGAAYRHPTGDGNHHVPATGTSNNGKVLMAGSTAGSESWQKLTKSDISDFPTSLPNPAALTISLNGTSQGAYNGSSAKNINITPDSIGASEDGHTHNYAGSSTVGGAANSVKSSLIVKLNGGTKEGTNMFTFNGSAAKTVNITASSIGAATSGHTHTHDKITDFDDAVEALIPSSLPTANSLVVKLNGGTKEGTNMFTFNGSSAKSINITPAAIGAAASSHNHSAANITSGTLAIARGGTGLTASPSMLVNLGSDDAANVFTASPRPGVTGTLPIANGGTGATSAAAARTALGITPANIGAATTSHNHTTDDITDFEEAVNGLIPSIPSKLPNPQALTFTGAVSATYDGSTAKTINIPTSGATDEDLIIKLNGGTTEGTNMFTFDGGTAKTVNITPSSIGAATSSHTHTHDKITDFDDAVEALLPSIPTSLPNPAALTISLNGTSQGAYTGSAAKSINITPSSIGAAASSHSHSLASTNAAGYLRQLNGSTSQFMRGDGTWATPPNTTYSAMAGASSSAAGKAGLVPAPAAGAANRYLRSDGTWSVPPDTNTTYTLSSFGITATAAEINKLDGVTATKDEINFLDGVTGNVQTQLNGKASASHTHNYAGSSSAGGAANSVKSSLVVKLNGGSNEGTNMFTFNGGTAKTINITASSIGAATSGHSHTHDKITDFDDAVEALIPSSLPTANSLIVKLNGGTNEGTNQFTFNGSVAKTVNITPSAIGAAASSHTHNYAGSTSAGGAANSAVKLQTARKLNGTTFNGTVDVNIPNNYFAQVSSGTDLNNMKTYGEYYASGGSGCKNIPSGVDHFYLRVFRSASGYTAQYLYEDNKSFTRFFNGDEWTGWIETYTSANKPTLSELGAAAASHTHTASQITGLPTALKNPYALTFTGAVTGTYDGSSAKTINIPTSQPTENSLVVKFNGGTKEGTNMFTFNGGTAKTINITPTAIGAAASNHSHSLASTGASGYLRQLNGSTSQFMRGDGTWATPPNTTYSNMTGASSSAAGKAGLVPAPAAGAANRYLRSDGTWQVPPDTNTTYSNMTGASSSAAGKAGLVPAPAAGAANRYLRSDGTWQVPPDTKTTLSSLGITATASEINKLDGVTATKDEINFLDGVTSNIQTQLNGKASSSHTHNYAGSSSAGGAANSVKTSLIVKLNGGSTEGTNMFTFNGSAAKTINITPSSIGAAAASHGTHVSYSTSAPLAAGTASAGSASTVARSDHRHPLQTTVSGNAGTATKLATARTISLTGDATGSASFDGSANASIPVSVKNHTYTDIPSNSNLNSYTDPGWYRCTSNATAATITNSPTDNAFVMIVNAHAGTNQIVIEYMTSAFHIWTRNYFDNTWGSWAEIYTTIQKPTASEIGAAASSHNHAANNITSGTLAVARGGTGITANPSMLINLGSRSAANVFASNPRPGITGVLSIANGGTGADTAAEARTALGAAAASHTHNYAGSSSSGGPATSANKVNVPVGTVLFSTSSSSTFFSSCFGGTWTVVGNVDAIVGGSSTLKLYMFRKTAS